MGNPNQVLFLNKYKDILEGPFLEIGSKDYGNTQNLRPLFTDKDKYVGVDMEAGTGVDIVLNLTSDFQQIDAKLKGQRFGTIFCLSVLEHCEQPFKMADTLAGLLEPRGHICISAPFSWKVHAYPDDYWRFTPAGIEKLFPMIEFDKSISVAVDAKQGVFNPIDSNIGKIPFSLSRHRKKGHPIRGLSAGFLGGLSQLGILRWLAGNAYVLAPTNIMMIGKPKV